MQSRVVQTPDEEFECRAEIGYQPHARAVNVKFFSKGEHVATLRVFCWHVCPEYSRLVGLSDGEVEHLALTDLIEARLPMDASRAVASCRALQKAGPGVDYACTVGVSWHPDEGELMKKAFQQTLDYQAAAPQSKDRGG